MVLRLEGETVQSKRLFIWCAAGRSANGSERNRGSYVGGERQQDSGRAQTSGGEKREQSAVLMCQEPEVVTGGVVHPGMAAAVMCSSFSYRRMALSW